MTNGDGEERNDDGENGKCKRSDEGEEEGWSKERRGNEGEAGTEGGCEEGQGISQRSFIIHQTPACTLLHSAFTVL